jgi:hypothetical protein
MMVRENVRCKMKNVKYLYLLDSGLHFPFFIFNDLPGRHSAATYKKALLIRKGFFVYA